MNKKYILLIVIGILIASVGFWYLNVREGEDKIIDNQQLSTDEAGQRMLDFVNKMLEPQGITASLVNVIEKSGIYSVTIEIAGETHQHYITKDGQFLFPEGINIDEAKEETKKRQGEARIRQEERTKCEEFQAELTPERKEKIAKCLTERGFIVYIADWCPFCRQQKELFGAAAKYLPYIDCYDPEGERGNLAKCPGLRGVPLWKDGKGNEVPGGMIQIRRLVKASGCDF